MMARRMGRAKWRCRNLMRRRSLIIICFGLFFSVYCNLQSKLTGEANRALIVEKPNSSHMSILCKNQHLPDSLSRDWKYIDETLSKEYPMSRVSGGIFLYPRQALLLSNIVRKLATAAKRNLRVCETGFGSGHSTALFLNAAPSVELYSFDKFDRKYQIPIWNKLNQTYANQKMERFTGNSCKKVPQHLSPDQTTTTTVQCDILHGASLCNTDNIGLVENSPCGVLLTSTAMDSLLDRAVYFGNQAQWRKLRIKNCIGDIICFTENESTLDRGFIFAKNNTSFAHKFCIAVTTGNCQTKGVKCNGQTDIGQLIKELKLDKLCPEYQVEVPG